MGCEINNKEDERCQKRAIKRITYYGKSVFYKETSTVDRTNIYDSLLCLLGDNVVCHIRGWIEDA